MNMYRRLSVPDYIVYGLLALGLITRFLRNPGPLLVPVAVFGIIFLLYKFPPNQFFKNRSSHNQRRAAKPTARMEQEERERRKRHFKVIYGSKPDNEDEPPPYH